MAEEEHLSEPLVDPRAPWEEVIEDPEAPRKLLAVMFTDIVGSTELATGLGDKRWRELVDQHHAAIRAQIARFGGREVDTAGDAFFATFDLPIRAVDCALESMRAVRRLGLRIRAGVHMGECVVSNGAVRGVTVHIGARVGSKARGDELLVSSTVRDILAGAGLRFLDRGEQTLKGVEGRWRLYAVEPRERDNEADLPRLLEYEVAKPPAPWFKQRRVVVAAATALAVLIGAIGYVTLFGSGGLNSVPADSVASIDAASGDVQSYVSVNRRPVGVAVGRDGVWVANSIDRSVTKIDRAGQSSTITVGAGPTALAINGDTAFVANGDGASVSRVSGVVRQQVGAPIRAGNGLADVGFGAGRLWITNAIDGTLWAIDPTTGSKTREVAVGPGLRGLAVTGDAVWAASETAGTITQVNPESGVIVRVVEVGHGPVAVAVGDGAVWVANRSDGTATRVDVRSGRVTATQRVGRGPRAIAISGSHVFVANEESATVSMLDARTGRPLRTIPLRNVPMGLAADGDKVWVSVRGGPLSYRGGTLRLGTNDLPDTLDPSVLSSLQTFQLTVVPAVYDGLTAFKRVGGPEGNQLVSNLVEEIRPPTDQGTTYTFALRPGLMYSEGTPVRASDVRSTFERIYLNEAYGETLLGILKGADRCSRERCDLSEGIVTDDRARTVVFHLRKAYADFPYHLAVPSLVIVPGKIGKENARFKPVPGTGPYRFAEVDVDLDKGRGRIALERNPRFRPRELAQPDGYADRIEITLGEPEEHLIDGIRNGTRDLVGDFGFSPEAGVDRLASELPAQIHVVEMPWNLFVVLNTSAPPFDDVNVRKALNFALDRKKMINVQEDLIHGDVSCQLLPKNTIGFVPYCPYTRTPSPAGLWYGPDLDTARRLVRESGTLGQKVTVWIEGEDSPSATRRAARGPIVAEALRSIGYVASVETVPGGGQEYFDAMLEPGTRRQVFLSGWATDYPGAANFVIPLLTCPATLTRLGLDPGLGANGSHYCSNTLDGLTDKAIAAQLDDPAAARDQWAHVDKAVTDDAVFVPWANLRTTILSSRRAGNVQGHPVYGVLFTQVWVVEEPKATPS